jgi:hypothetical protein
MSRRRELSTRGASLPLSPGLPGCSAGIPEGETAELCSGGAGDDIDKSKGALWITFERNMEQIEAACSAHLVVAVQRRCRMPQRVRPRAPPLALGENGPSSLVEPEACGPTEMHGVQDQHQVRLA